MINFRRNTKEPSVNKSSRSKSIYNGDQSHTLSMNIKIQHDFSPETFRHPKNQIRDIKDNKELKNFSRHIAKQNHVNKSMKFRESVKLMQSSYSGKKSHRQDMYRRSAKKIIQARPLETERLFKQNSNLTSRKNILMKPEKSSSNITQQHLVQSNKTKKTHTLSTQDEIVTVSYQQMKDILTKMKKMALENTQLRKHIKFYQDNKSKNTVSRVLRI